MRSLFYLLCYEIHVYISCLQTNFVSRQLKNYNKVKFLEDLERVYWDDLVDHDDPTNAAQFWTRVFVGLLDKHAPFRRRKGKNIYAPWVTPELIGRRRTRDILNL